jgi:hypothetical protein
MQYIGEQVKKLADLLTVEMTVDEIICRLHDILKLVATDVDDSYTVLYEIESPPATATVVVLVRAIRCGQG